MVMSSPSLIVSDSQGSSPCSLLPSVCMARKGEGGGGGGRTGERERLRQRGDRERERERQRENVNGESPTNDI